jgi:hypothetical protein
MNKEKRETEFANQFFLLKNLKWKTKDTFQIVQNIGFKRILRAMYYHILKFKSKTHALNVVKKVSCCSLIKY